MRFKFFYGQKCPKCPSFKILLEQLKMDGEWIDTSTPDGFEEAKKHNVQSVPHLRIEDENNQLVKVITEREQLDIFVREYNEKSSR